MRSAFVFKALLALTVFSQLGFASGPLQGAAAEESFFPMAVWYGGGKARAPMLEKVDATSAERWEKDLDKIKSVGFNTVKCWVDWATAEPGPGVFDFQNLDLLMRLARERGLRVVVQIYLDSAPDWVGEKYPDGRFVDRSGAVITSQAAPGYCVDNPDVRNAIVSFLAALSREANKSTALYGWDVWSEPHVINWADFPYLYHPEFCYCRYSQERFRGWLKQKYGTLETINAAWYRRFESWDQVQPPRFSTILSFTDYLDWRAFITDKLAGDLKTRVDAIRSADHAHPITSHAAVPGLFTSPTDGYGEPDDWKMAENADFFGTSVYPKHAASTRPWPYRMIAAGLDFTRSSGHSFGKGFWIGELQAGQGVTGMRIAEPVDSHDEQFWLWQVLSHGAREISIYAWYPMSSGYESNGYGLINLDGTLTPRSHAAGKVARQIESNGRDLLESTPAPAQVAILYNRLSYMVGGAQPSLSKLGNATRDSLEGVHRAFFEKQIPVDFVHTMDVVGNKLAQYKILFMPYPVMLSRDVTEGIVRYIKNGGTVVAEARLAWNDERGFSSNEVPGQGLATVFGARERVIRPMEKPELVVEPAAGLPGVSPGTRAFAEAFQEELEPLPGSRILARFADGAPAVVENHYGKGKAILVGSFLGLAYQRQKDDAAARELMLGFARAAGVEPEVAVSGTNTTEVEVRRLVSDNVQFLFAFNHSPQPAEATIAIKMPWAIRTARSVNEDQKVSPGESEGRVVLTKALSGGEIWVVRLDRK